MLQTALGTIVVGAGLMGRWHAAAIRRAGGRVIAIVDSNESRATSLARRIRGAQVYIDLDQAVRQAQPRVVHLCTPTPVHREQAELALKCGAHVIVEKPLAATVEDTQEILLLAERQHLLVCPVHQFVFQDGVRRVHSWLKDAGDVRQVSFTIHSAGGTGLAHDALDALAADILPHPLSLLQSLLPGSLEVPWTVHRPAPGELRVFGTKCRSAAGGYGVSIELSLHARPTVNSLSIAAENATLYADLFHGFAFRLPGKVSRTQKIIQPFETSIRHLQAATSNLTARTLRRESAYPGLQRFVSLFYRALRTQNRSPIPAEDILAVARARQIILES